MRKTSTNIKRLTQEMIDDYVPTLLKQEWIHEKVHDFITPNI